MIMVFDNITLLLLLRTWAPTLTGFFARGGNQGSGGRTSPSGVQGRSPGGDLGEKPPEADGIVLNKDTQTFFPVYVDIIYM